MLSSTAVTATPRRRLFLAFALLVALIATGLPLAINGGLMAAEMPSGAAGRAARVVLSTATPTPTRTPWPTATPTPSPTTCVPVGATTERVSVASDGTEANTSSEYGSEFPSISADGRYVAFRSLATNLVPGDTNDLADIFVRDRVTGATERVSVGFYGQADLGASVAAPSISADGQYVAFASLATNLVPGDTNLRLDVFVRDRVAGTTERVSVVSAGVEANNDSGLVGVSISADGRYVAFDSYATNLVPGDTNGTSDVFVRDRVAGTTERVSIASDGTQADRYSYLGATSFGGRSVSADGRYVAFLSDATNLAPGDTNGASDIFVRDRVAVTTERVSIATDGSQANQQSHYASVSADGRYVAFDSYASNLVPSATGGGHDVFVRDRVAGVTERVSIATDGSQANDNSWYPDISADGRYVAFSSWASNLVPDDTNGNGSDVFVHDRVLSTTERVSVSSAGAEANGFSRYPSISADGRYVAFPSLATNLVPADTNGGQDVFVRDRGDTCAIPPVASFYFSPLSGGCAPLTVTFIDTSWGTIDSRLWDFGDGITTILTSIGNPTHTYTAAGVYTPSLTVSGPGGSDTETRLAVEVGPTRPQADFVGFPVSGTAPLDVQFAATITGSYSDIEWDFGDGGHSYIAELMPTHTYVAPGVYTVSLYAGVMMCGVYVQKTDYITVTSEMPTPTPSPIATGSPLPTATPTPTPTPTATPVPLRGDADGDGVVDIADLVLLGANFGLTAPPADSRADLNGDGVVNIFDLAVVGANFGRRF